MAFLIKGMIIGLAAAAPVGPINILCMRRTIARGRIAGFVSGLGAAFADSLYGVIAAFGFTSVKELFLSHSSILKISGGIFLVFLGAKIALKRLPGGNDRPIPETKGRLYDFGTTFLLTLTNPLTILAFTAIFAVIGIGLGNHRDISAGLVVFGVFLGSSLWWASLALFFGRIGKEISLKRMIWINRFAGILIAVFGMVAVFAPVK